MRKRPKLPSTKKWRAEAFTEVKAILEAIEERRRLRKLTRGELAGLAERGVANWYAWDRAVREERLDYLPAFDTLFAFARPVDLAIGLKPDVSVDGSGTTLTAAGVGRHMHIQTRQMAALMEQLPEQARKDLLDYAESYVRTWVKPPQPEAPANPIDPAAKE